MSSVERQLAAIQPRGPGRCGRSQTTLGWLQQEFDAAFVLMEYFGYLGRDPNSGPDTNFAGYDFWLTKLDNAQGNFQNSDMVKSFLVATEYRGRFPR
jgi:hypothetical protein